MVQFLLSFALQNPISMFKFRIFFIFFYYLAVWGMFLDFLCWSIPDFSMNRIIYEVYGKGELAGRLSLFSRRLPYHPLGENG